MAHALLGRPHRALHSAANALILSSTSVGRLSICAGEGGRTERQQGSRAAVDRAQGQQTEGEQSNKTECSRAAGQGSMAARQKGSMTEQHTTGVLGWGSCSDGATASV